MFSRCMWFAALASLSWLSAPARAELPPVTAAIEARDILQLESLRETAATPDERRLADGAALSLRHRDEAALAVLDPLARSAPDRDIRAAACLALSDITLRQGRYAETRAALICAQDVSGRPLTGEAAQVLDWATILSGEKPMRLARPVAGRLDVWRDPAGLIRVSVEINGKSRDAMIDTDASLCVVSESGARRLGLRVFEKGTTILTTIRPDLPMRLGVADDFKIGDAVFGQVVFAVLPDAALRFGGGYRTDLVVGLPVFVALGRIELVREGGWTSLYYGARMGGAAADANVILTGLDPFALVRAEKSGALLRLAIDTAASNTELNATALREFPALGEGSTSGWAHWEGGGGSATDYRARVLHDLTLSVEGRPVVLKRVKILSAAERDRHGMLGQDMLLKGKRWVLDFDSMSFAIGD